MLDSSPKAFFCPQCFYNLPYNNPPFCPKCCRHLTQPSSQNFCSPCLKTKTFFDFAWGCCLYKEPVKNLLLSFKYRGKTYLKYPFLKIMAGFIELYQYDIRQFDSLVPIPLFATRSRERGYNQSLLLAQELAKEYRLDLSSDNLMRIRHTQSQSLLGQKERWTNIREAFKIKHPFRFKGKNILLIDDLLTTGATASEAALVLKEAGAKSVGVLTLAQAHLEEHLNENY